MSETATALSRNHYQVWIGKRHKKLLRHLFKTITKRGDGRSRLLRYLTKKFCGAEMARKEGWMVSRGMPMSYDFYKSDKEEPGDD